MNVTLVFSLLINMRLQPHDSRARCLLRRFETRSLFCAIFTLQAGFLIADDGWGKATPMIKQVAAVSVLALHLLLFIGELLEWLQFTWALPLQISIEGGAYLTKNAKRWHGLARS